jgi:hypothetical protein
VIEVFDRVARTQVVDALDEVEIAERDLSSQRADGPSRLRSADDASGVTSPSSWSAIQVPSLSFAIACCGNACCDQA